MRRSIRIELEWGSLLEEEVVKREGCVLLALGGRSACGEALNFGLSRRYCAGVKTGCGVLVTKTLRKGEHWPGAIKKQWHV